MIVIVAGVIFGSVVVGMFNLVGDPASAAGLTNGANGNIVGKDDGAGGRTLLPLAEIVDPVLRNNGGSTLTYSLIPGSLAIDAGSDIQVASIEFDQRGMGFPRRAGSHVDIGAVEMSPPAAPAKPDFAPSLVDATPKAATVGSTVNVATAVNNPSNAASGSFTIEYRLMFESQANTYYSLKTVTRPGIAGNGNQQWTEPVNIPAYVLPGTYRMSIFVDPSGTIDEANENNNFLTDNTTISVTAAAATTPTPTPSPSNSSITLQLVVHYLSASGPVQAGANVSIVDSTGRAVNIVTDVNGVATASVAAGVLRFTISKTGFLTNSWEQTITTSGRRDAYFLATASPAPTPSPTPTPVSTPSLGITVVMLRDQQSLLNSLVKGANDVVTSMASDMAAKFVRYYSLPLTKAQAMTVITSVWNGASFSAALGRVSGITAMRSDQLAAAFAKNQLSLSGAADFGVGYISTKILDYVFPNRQQYSFPVEMLLAFVSTNPVGFALVELFRPTQESNPPFLFTFQGHSMVAPFMYPDVFDRLVAAHDVNGLNQVASTILKYYSDLASNYSLSSTNVDRLKQQLADFMSSLRKLM